MQLTFDFIDDGFPAIAALYQVPGQVTLCYLTSYGAKNHANYIKKKYPPDRFIYADRAGNRYRIRVNNSGEIVFRWIAWEPAMTTSSAITYSQARNKAEIEAGRIDVERGRIAFNQDVCRESSE